MTNIFKLSQHSENNLKGVKPQLVDVVRRALELAQLNLFDENAPRAGSDKLMEVLDHLNAKDGKGTLYFAGQGIQQQWQMKREMRNAVPAVYYKIFRSAKGQMSCPDYLVRFLSTVDVCDSGSTSYDMATFCRPLHTSRAVPEKNNDFEHMLELMEKNLQGYRIGARPHAGSYDPRRTKRTND